MWDIDLPRLTPGKRYEFTKKDVDKLRSKMKDEREVFKEAYPEMYELLFGKK